MSVSALIYARLRARLRTGRMSLTPSPGATKAGTGQQTAQPFPLSVASDQAAATFNGSAAIHRVATLLGLGKGDTVLMPVYCCGSEQKPFEMLGCQINYFGVDDQLAFDADAVMKQVDESTRLVYITHYFGFFQPDTERLVSLCKQRNVPVLEDCALSLYSGKPGVPCGSVAAYSIFSQRKTLGLTEGGYLVSNNGPLPFDPLNLPAPPALPALDRLINSTVSALNENWPTGKAGWRRWLSLAVLLPVSLLVKALRIVGQRLFTNWLSPEAEGQPALAMYGYGMSKRMHAAFVHADADAVRHTRRENYKVWLSSMDKLPGCRPVFADLPDDCVPLFMPVLCDDHERAKAFFDERNIEVSPWWFDERTDIDWTQHADVLTIKRAMLVLPVHQLIEPAMLRQRLG